MKKPKKTCEEWKKKQNKWEKKRKRHAGNGKKMQNKYI